MASGRAITYQCTHMNTCCVSALRSVIQNSWSATQSHTRHSRRKHWQIDPQNIPGARHIKMTCNPNKEGNMRQLFIKSSFLSLGGIGPQLPCLCPLGRTTTLLCPRSIRFVVHLNWFLLGIILLCDSQLLLGAVSYVLQTIHNHRLW